MVENILNVNAIKSLHQKLLQLKVITKLYKHHAPKSQLVSNSAECDCE